MEYQEFSKLFRERLESRMEEFEKVVAKAKQEMEKNEQSHNKDHLTKTTMSGKRQHRPARSPRRVQSILRKT